MHAGTSGLVRPPNSLARSEKYSKSRVLVTIDYPRLHCRPVRRPSVLPDLTEKLSPRWVDKWTDKWLVNNGIPCGSGEINIFGTLGVNLYGVVEVQGYCFFTHIMLSKNAREKTRDFFKNSPNFLYCRIILGDVSHLIRMRTPKSKILSLFWSRSDNEHSSKRSQTRKLILLFYFNN